MSKNVIEVDRKSLNASLKDLFDRAGRLDPKALRKIQRKAFKPMAQAMASNSKSTRLAKMVGITTRKKYAPANGIRIGVVKNDKGLFPQINAQGLAAIIEYGTGERRQPIKVGAITVGSRNVGSVTAEPWIRPAYDSHVRRAMDSTETELIKLVQK